MSGHSSNLCPLSTYKTLTGPSYGWHILTHAIQPIDPSMNNNNKGLHIGLALFFLESKVLYRAHYSFIPIPVMVSHSSIHSCPGADWQKRGCHTAPTAPPTTTNIHIHSHSYPNPNHHQHSHSYTFTQGKVGEVSCPGTQRRWNGRPPSFLVFLNGLPSKY